MMKNIVIRVTNPNNRISPLYVKIADLKLSHSKTTRKLDLHEMVQAMNFSQQKLFPRRIQSMTWFLNVCKARGSNSRRVILPLHSNLLHRDAVCVISFRFSAEQKNVQPARSYGYWKRERDRALAKVVRYWISRYTSLNDENVSWQKDEPLIQQNPTGTPIVKVEICLAEIILHACPNTRCFPLDDATSLFRKSIMLVKYLFRENERKIIVPTDVSRLADLFHELRFTNAFRFSWIVLFICKLFPGRTRLIM